MADETPTPKLPRVQSQEGALIGDENLPGPREPDVEVEQRQDRAQVVATPESAPDTVEVFEVAVTTDTVITDPSDPLAVQVPDAGRGSLLLPIHQFVGARTVEEVFAEEAGENRDADLSNEDRAAANAQGQTPSLPARDKS